MALLREPAKRPAWNKRCSLPPDIRRRGRAPRRQSRSLLCT